METLAYVYMMTEYELPDGELALTIELPVPPFNVATIVGDDTSDDCKAVLQSLESNWDELWPKMLVLLKDAMEHLDLELNLAEQELLGSASRLKPGVYMADKSDIYLSFNFGDAPDWDYFIRGAEIVHFQPVF